MPALEPEIVRRRGPHALAKLYDDPAWRAKYFQELYEETLAELKQALAREAQLMKRLRNSRKAGR